MAQPDTLTDNQVEVLRWIADGCPDGVMTDTRHRITAAALRRRGLAHVTGTGRTWKAKITARGREYLAAVDGPNPPVARQPNGSVTQQLVDEILAAGGVLRVPRRSYYDPAGIDYERRARLAERHGKTPAGMWLEIVRDRDGIELRIEKLPEGLPDATTALPDIPVPTTVGKYHRAARAFRDNRADHTVSEAQLSRAVRILHAVAHEADKRGWPAEPSTGGLAFEAAGLPVTMALKEAGVHKRGPWDREVRYYRDYTPMFRSKPAPRGRYDQDATGNLELAITTSLTYLFSGRQSRWGDRQAWKLDDRLPHLFREIETRIVLAQHEAHRSRLAAEQAAERARIEQEQRERQWDIHMANARAEVHKQNRVRRLLDDASAWTTAQRLHEYCNAAEAAHGDHNRTQDYLRWARAYAISLDPLSEPPQFPPDAEATDQELQEQLPAGWSVAGPNQSSQY